MVLASLMAVSMGAAMAQPDSGKGPGGGAGQMGAGPAASAPGMGMGPGGGRGAARYGSDYTPGWTLMSEQERNEHRDQAARWLAEATLVRNERDALQARLYALTPAPVKPLSAERRRAVLHAVNDCAGDVYAPTAETLAAYLAISELPGCLAGLSPTSIARFVSRLAAEGWLVSDGKKPARYSLTDAGRADLAVAS
jgi:hypothetical protein